VSEFLKIHPNGQWTLEKSNSVKPFGENVYDNVANINRKANRTSEERPEAGPNVAAHKYTSATFGSAKQQAATEAKQVKAKSGPVKTYSDEEKAAFQAQYEKKPA
jgi:hypothetical protein